MFTTEKPTYATNEKHIISEGQWETSPGSEILILFNALILHLNKLMLQRLSDLPKSTFISKEQDPYFIF